MTSREQGADQFGLPLDPKEWKAFEKLIADLHSDPAARVQHDVKVRGRSNEEYQVDVLVEYGVGPYSFKVVVSCKDWKRPVDRPRVNELFAVMEDCRAHKGVVASASGFTEGAVQYAKDKNIELLHLKPMTAEEWAKEAGTIQRVEINGELIGFNLEGVTLKTPLADELPPGLMKGLHEQDADLYNSGGQVVGNAVEIINVGVPGRIEPTDDLQKVELDFPPDSNLRFQGLTIPAFGWIVTFRRTVYRQRIVVDLADVVKAVLENIITGQRHRVTKENELWIDHGGPKLIEVEEE